MALYLNRRTGEITAASCASEGLMDYLGYDLIEHLSDLAYEDARGYDQRMAAIRRRENGSDFTGNEYFGY